MVNRIVTSQMFGSLRNNYGQRVGMSFTVGASPVSISALGRWIVAGNTQSHQLAIVNGSNGIDIAVTTLATAGAAAGDYAFANLASPVVLAAGSTYLLMSQEFAAGDYWYDQKDVTMASAFSYWNSAYQTGVNSYAGSFAGSSYVPVNALLTPSNSMGSTFFGAIA